MAEPGKPQNRWSRAAREASNGDAETETSEQRALAEPSPEAVKGTAPPPGPNARLVFTIGTWRVSREVYIWRLTSLGVQLLVDVRGNPRAGREEQLHRGKDFQKALAGAGIRYEYWGDKLGEDALESGDEESLQRLLKGLLASAPPGPICLLGHLHEAHKCHRLRLCDLLPLGCYVQHLVWEDNQHLRQLGHEEAKDLRDSAASYFLERRRREEDRRAQERQEALEAAKSHPASSSSSSCSSWRSSKTRQRSQEEQAALLAAAALTAKAAALPHLVWEATPAAEWAERLRDGHDYRLVLPFGCELLWYPHFLSKDEADKLDETIKEKVVLYHPTYQFQTASGVVQHTINRKGQARICDDFNFSVQYSTRKDVAWLYECEKTALQPWVKPLLRRVEGASETVFNAVWCNHYRDGTVTIHWHTDGDEGLGPNPLIGSLSIGTTREFSLKSKRSWPGAPGAPHPPGVIHLGFPLFHGSLLVMGQNSQTHWLHAVPAMEGIRQERTNLTFRFYALQDLEAKEEEDGPVAQAKVSGPFRVHLSPELSCPRSTRQIVVDGPNDPATTVGQFIRQLTEHVLPTGLGRVSLALPLGASTELAYLQDDQPCITELLRLGWQRSSQVRLRLVTDAKQRPADAPVVEACPPGLAWRGMLGPTAAEKVPGADQLLRELCASPPGNYSPPTGPHGLVPVTEGGDWIWEVVQNLSGIQRKSKGRGHLSKMVFHQCSEFVVLYVGRSKSSLHLVLVPKRPLRRDQATSQEAPLLLRLGFYGAWLVQQVARERPGLFAVGFRVRAGQAQQLHADLLSMDLAAPDAEDLQQRHFDDFTGLGHFVPLEDLAAELAAGRPLPSVAPPLDLRKGLACHRCGQLFGDAIRELSRHLHRCERWPDFASKAKGSAPQAYQGELETLQEMGFGSCGKEVLAAVLAEVEGNVEMAVTMLTSH